MLKRFLLILFLGLFWAATASAADPAIRIDKAWARATMKPGATGVVYLTVSNSGPAADRLVSVSSPVAAGAGLHIMVMEGTVMQMRPVDALDVKPGDTVPLKPGGLHIMLTNLKQALKQGQHFPLTLDFEKAGRVEVEVTVLPLGASGYP